MNIAFLDIDGVLNHELFYRGYSKSTRAKNRPYSEIDTESVHILNGLVKETDAKIVVSSTWRLSHTAKQLQEYLIWHGFIGEVIDTTPHFGDSHSLRGNEIRAWIKTNETLLQSTHSDFTKYVIFDDDSDMLLWQRNNYIRVDNYCGLTPNNVYRAIRFLSGKATTTGED